MCIISISRMEHKHTLHPITPEGQKFLDSLTSEARALQVLAQKMLGSSYFVEQTHGFRAWLASKTTEAKAPAKKE